MNTINKTETHVSEATSNISEKSCMSVVKQKRHIYITDKTFWNELGRNWFHIIKEACLILLFSGMSLFISAYYGFLWVAFWTFAIHSISSLFLQDWSFYGPSKHVTFVGLSMITLIKLLQGETKEHNGWRKYIVVAMMFIWSLRKTILNVFYRRVQPDSIMTRNQHFVSESKLISGILRSFLADIVSPTSKSKLMNVTFTTLNTCIIGLPVWLSTASMSHSLENPWFVLSDIVAWGIYIFGSLLELIAEKQEYNNFQTTKSHIRLTSLPSDDKAFSATTQEVGTKMTSHTESDGSSKKWKDHSNDEKDTKDESENFSPHTADEKPIKNNPSSISTTTSRPTKQSTTVSPSSDFVKSGLWAYSQNPNLFGEILIFTGISLSAVRCYWPPLRHTLSLGPIFLTLSIAMRTAFEISRKHDEACKYQDERSAKYVRSTSVLALLPKP